MPGKNVLITGATAGVGFHIAAELARSGARVFITGRNELRGHEAVAELRLLACHDFIEFIAADASSVEDNVALAEALSHRIDRLDILINNAGGVFAERGETDEGFERTLALNFIGPVILTQHVLRLIGRSRSGRIVNVVSSAFQNWKGNPFDDPQSRRRYAGVEAYSRAKLLNLLFTLALSQDLRGAGVAVNAVNPVPQTSFVRWFHGEASPAKAADAVAALAMSVDSILTGWYVEGRREKRLPRHLLDDALQNRAWELGETLAARALQATRGVATNHRFPKGSATVAWRSPYGLSSGAMIDVAPARVTTPSSSLEIRFRAAPA